MPDREDLTGIKESEKLPKDLREYEGFVLFGASFLALKKSKDEKKFLKLEEKHEKELKKLFASVPPLSLEDKGDKRFLRIIKQFEAVLGDNEGYVRFDKGCVRLIIKNPWWDKEEEKFEELGRVMNFGFQSNFRYNLWFVLEVAKRAGKGEWVLKNNEKGYLFLYRDKVLVGIVLPIIEEKEE